MRGGTEMSDVQKQIKEALKESSEIPWRVVIANAPIWLVFQQKLIEQKDEEIKELLRVNSVKSSKLFEKDQIIEQLKAEIQT